MSCSASIRPCHRRRRGAYAPPVVPTLARGRVLRHCAARRDQGGRHQRGTPHCLDGPGAQRPFHPSRLEHGRRSGRRSATRLGFSRHRSRRVSGRFGLCRPSHGRRLEARRRRHVTHSQRPRPGSGTRHGRGGQVHPRRETAAVTDLFNPRGTEVSVILDLMIHDIDIILSIVKSDVKNISASGVGVMTETPDIANVRIEFQNGCVANLTSSRISMKKMRKMRLFQKDAYIGIDFLNKKSEIIKQKEAGDTNVFAFDIETPNGKKTIAIANPSVPEVNAIKKELEEFKNAITTILKLLFQKLTG